MNTVELVVNRFKEVGYKPNCNEILEKVCYVRELSRIYEHMTIKQIVNTVIQFSEYGGDYGKT